MIRPRIKFGNYSPGRGFRGLHGASSASIIIILLEFLLKNFKGFFDTCLGFLVFLRYDKEREHSRRDDS